MANKATPDKTAKVDEDQLDKGAGTTATAEGDDESPKDSPPAKQEVVEAKALVKKQAAGANTETEQAQAQPTEKEAAAQNPGVLVAATPPNTGKQPAAPAGAAAPAAGEPKPPAAGVLPSRPPELAPKPHVLAKPVKRPDPPLDITGYLSAADLERVLGKKRKFRRSQLPGVSPSKGYNAVYYASKSGKSFGVSVQVWRDASLVDSRTRFNSMRNTYTDVVPTNKVTEQGFRAYFSGVVTLVFAEPRKPMVAAVSCAVKLCNPDAIIELSRRVAERLH